MIIRKEIFYFSVISWFAIDTCMVNLLWIFTHFFCTLYIHFGLSAKVWFIRCRILSFHFPVTFFFKILNYIAYLFVCKILYFVPGQKWLYCWTIRVNSTSNRILKWFIYWYECVMKFCHFIDIHVPVYRLEIKNVCASCMNCCCVKYVITVKCLTCYSSQYCLWFSFSFGFQSQHSYSYMYVAMIATLSLLCSVFSC